MKIVTPKKLLAAHTYIVKAKGEKTHSRAFEWLRMDWEWLGMTGNGLGMVANEWKWLGMDWNSL